MKSYYLNFAHLKESCKACLQKQERLQHAQKYFKVGFENQFYGKKKISKYFFFFLENSLLDIVKTFFKKKALKANASFKFLESQWPKIKSKPKALKVKLSKGKFGNCFFPLFYVSKKFFIFLKLKNLFGNTKWTKTKTIFKTQFVKKIENRQKIVFSFKFSKVNENMHLILWIRLI